MYLGIISGKSPTQLANELTAEGILNPSSPEELEHEREIDRRAYAKKKAARLAKEAAKRAEIFAGT